MKGIEHDDRLKKFAADNVGVATERVQCGRADPSGKRRALGDEPVGVAVSGAALRQAKRACLRSAALVAGLVQDFDDEPGAGRAHGEPYELVDPVALTSVNRSTRSTLCSISGLAAASHQGAPAHSKHPGQGSRRQHRRSAVELQPK